MSVLNDEINKLKSKFSLSIEEAIILYYAILLRIYFTERAGEVLDKEIASLVSDQIHRRIPLEQIDRALLDELKSNVQEYLKNGNVDIVSSLYEKLIDTTFKKILGKFYTPPALVNHLLNAAEIENNIDGKIIDLSCGAGVFLCASARIIIRKSSNINSRELIRKIENQLFGVDIDEFACTLTRLNLLLATFPIWLKLLGSEEDLKIKFNVLRFNSLELLKLDSPILGQKFDFVIGNPPYVEAKKLPKKDKKLCKDNFPETATGAFDLYICFIDLGLKVLRENGCLSFVLPNKFEVAKYAIPLRKTILEKYRIIEISDISNLKYFEGTDVYPILFTLRKERKRGKVRVMCNLRSKQIFENGDFRFVEVDQQLFEVFKLTLPFYCFETDTDKSIFLKIIGQSKNSLEKFLCVRTTVSFHFKGLREKYVSKDIESPNKFKYIGGKSFSRKNEVNAYRLDWAGYYINYDESELKKIQNPLPPISIFKQPKIIFCQHAKRMLSYCDEKGIWVTKDVFPIAFVKKNGDKTIARTYYYTGFLNSNIFSYLYGIIYKGIQIGDGYFHFLPLFMYVIPTPNEDSDLIEEVAQAAKELQKIPVNDEQERIMNKIFYKMFMLTEEETIRVEEYNMEYLGK